MQTNFSSNSYPWTWHCLPFQLSQSLQQLSRLRKILPPSAKLQYDMQQINGQYVATTAQTTPIPSIEGWPVWLGRLVKMNRIKLVARWRKWRCRTPSTRNSRSSPLCRCHPPSTCKAKLEISIVHVGVTRMWELVAKLGENDWELSGNYPWYWLALSTSKPLSMMHFVSDQISGFAQESW